MHLRLLQYPTLSSHFFLVFFRPVSIAITSLWGKRAGLYAFRAFACFARVGLCLFPLPLGVKDWLQLVTMAFSGLFFLLSLSTVSTTASVGIVFLQLWSRRPDRNKSSVITKTCLYNVDPLKPQFYRGIDYFFLFLLKNIDCGYSLEPPRRGGSNEYQQSMF